MSKGKLEKFKEFDEFPNTFDRNVELKGKWNSTFFKNDNPICLELACGRGEYSVALAEMYPDINFIGIDIKGARLWKGAKISLEKKLDNVAFLRIQIDHIENYFANDEISKLWITFPDPQNRKSKSNKRLTSSPFLSRYRKICTPNCRVLLKTDSTLLYDYTKEVIEIEKLKLFTDVMNVYKWEERIPELDFKTYFENKWLEQGRKIKFLEFSLFSNG